jgi:hypothetical protein
MRRAALIVQAKEQRWRVGNLISVYFFSSDGVTIGWVGMTCGQSFGGVGLTMMELP